MNRVLSPITNTENIKLLKRIYVDELNQLYKLDLMMDIKLYFNGLDYIEMFECLDTGYIFFSPYNITGDENFYNCLKKQLPLIYNVPYYSPWKWEYSVSLKYIQPSDRVYEIGCGDGNFLKNLRERGVDKISGLELNHDSVLSAQSKGFNVEYITIEEKIRTKFELFDVVCTFQVLEHVCDVKPFLDSCISLLKPGGKLIISVPYNSPFLFRKDLYNTLNLPPHHMGLWGKKSFESLTKFFPLELVSMIIEKLPSSGYDFERYYKTNKIKLFSNQFLLQRFLDKLYYLWLKKFHKLYSGKNIVVIFQKNE
jgi:2-polyprenyl-3-methyl-5-hydroxy-6-metoxy-1,4-benzoquinol methylase